MGRETSGAQRPYVSHNPCTHTSEGLSNNYWFCLFTCPVTSLINRNSSEVTAESFQEQES